MKFEKGTWYSFSIIGKTNILEKGEHYILSHESGRKMLLNAEYYVKYNLTIGQTIQCRVDKVNCTGQVFLEPNHPYYTEGETYDFILLRIFSTDDSFYNATVSDFFANELDVYLNHPDDFYPNQLVSLQVIQIKKGLPILSQSTIDKNKHFEDNAEIKLIVKKIAKHNSEDYYILCQGAQVMSKIKVKHYKDYGFDVGDDIVCNILGKEGNERLIVEPKSPFYQIGGVYLFTKQSIEEYINLEGAIKKVIVVLDLSGKKCGVEISEYEAFSQHKNGLTIKCKVIGFRKGRPQLEIDLDNEEC